MPPKSQLSRIQRATDPNSAINLSRAPPSGIRNSYTLRSTSEAAISTTLGDGEEAIPLGSRIQTRESDEDTISVMSDTDNPRGKEPMASNADSDHGPSMVSVLSMMSEMLQLSRNEMKMERERAARREEEAAKWREDEEVRRLRKEKVREAEKIVDKIPVITEKQDVELYL